MRWTEEHWPRTAHAAAVNARGLFEEPDEIGGANALHLDAEADRLRKA